MNIMFTRIRSGKTMESTRNYRRVELAVDRKRVAKMVKRAEYISHKIFHEGLVAIELNNTQVFLNKPIFTGFTVLELSKAIMYRFHYKVSIRVYFNLESIFLY